MRKAFTMVELVFVIVVIGILAGVAVPKFAATRDDAVISKGRSTLAAVRNALATERQKRILRGNFDNISSLGAGFKDFLEYPVKNCSDAGCWSGSTDSYDFHLPGGGTCTYELKSNKFLNADTNGCSQLGD